MKVVCGDKSVAIRLQHLLEKSRLPFFLERSSMVHSEFIAAFTAVNSEEYCVMPGMLKA
jgi:hypothetical protein